MRKISAVSFRYLSFLSLLIVAPSVIASVWEHVDSPSHHSPQSIGSYANGCLSGASALPLEGLGYQVLRSERLRYFGHPNSVSFIQRLGEFSAHQLQTNLLVGDISLPRGGRFSSGHSSHQTGLDIDIWLKLADERLSAQQLSQPRAISVVDIEQYRLQKQNWDSRHFQLIKRAASDQAVARIFVHPVIKEKLCSSENSNDRAWLRKVRPWWGHHYHIHVRLKCPQGSAVCQPQAAPPKGDGCGYELTSWRPKPQIDEPEVAAMKPKKKPPKIMPAQCEMLLPDTQS